MCARGLQRYDELWWVGNSRYRIRGRGWCIDKLPGQPWISWRGYLARQDSKVSSWGQDDYTRMWHAVLHEQVPGAEGKSLLDLLFIDNDNDTLTTPRGRHSANSSGTDGTNDDPARWRRSGDLRHNESLQSLPEWDWPRIHRRSREAETQRRASSHVGVVHYLPHLPADLSWSSGRYPKPHSVGTA